MEEKIRYEITENFDKEFEKIEHYQRMPQMMPWVGNMYGKKLKKILFIAESHYFPKGSVIHLDKIKWYQILKKDLNSEEIEYSNTRYALQKNYKRNTIWREPAKIMIELGISKNSENIYENFAYYNFFQRPALEGKEILINAQDIEIANFTFNENIKILKPEIIIFLSVKAWNYCSERKKIDYIDFIDYVPHPSSRWWNRKAKKYSFFNNLPLSGSERFREIIKSEILNIKI
ncbi:MAG: hypothetical protein ACOYMA_14380 [Bacteroidia bacterium]